jgi:hypothetical protein
MNPEANQEIYRIAHDAASAQLNEISAEFERLRLRKDQIERLIAVLKPIIGADDQPAEVIAKEDAAADRVEITAEPAKEQNGQRLGVGADPFQRRIDHVLGIGGGIRDVRQYTRQF